MIRAVYILAALSFLTTGLLLWWAYGPVVFPRFPKEFPRFPFHQNFFKLFL